MTDDLSLLHSLEAFVDLVERTGRVDVFVDLQNALLPIFDQAWQLGATPVSMISDVLGATSMPRPT